MNTTIFVLCYLALCLFLLAVAVWRNTPRRHEARECALMLVCLALMLVFVAGLLAVNFL